MFSLQYDNLVPDVRSRVVKWLKTHVHLNSLPKKFNIKIRPAVPFKTELATIDGLDVAPAPEAETTGPISVKSVPARRRTRSDVRILNDGKKLCPSKEGFNNGGIILDKVMEDGAVNVSERLSEVSVPDVVGEVNFAFLSLLCCIALHGLFFNLLSGFFAALVSFALRISHHNLVHYLLVY